MVTNGKNKWIIWLSGILTTLILFITLPTMAKAIIDNDRRNVDKRNELKKEMIRRDEKIADKIETVKDIVTEIKVKQAEQMAILKRLAK